jgi:hypothetical protein
VRLLKEEPFWQLVEMLVATSFSIVSGARYHHRVSKDRKFIAYKISKRLNWKERRMLRSKTLIMFTVVMATVALFAATQAGAQQICPTECEAGPYRIEIVQPFPLQVNADGEYTCPSYPCWVWRYKYIDGPYQKVSQVYITYPDCCGVDNYIDILGTVCGGENHITAPCEVANGLNKYKWPMVCDDYTLRLPCNDQINPNQEFWFATDTSVIGLNTLGIKKGKKFYVCAIAGPDCPLGARSQTGTFASSECPKITGVPAGDVWMKFQREPGGCDVNPAAVSFHYDCDPCKPDSCDPLENMATWAPSEDDPIHITSGDLKQGCPESVRVGVTDAKVGCIEYTTNSGDKAQQCIDQNGNACDWEDDGCAAIFPPPEPRTP